MRASFEILKGYADVIAASVEGTLDNFTAVNGMPALPQEEEEGPFGILWTSNLPFLGYAKRLEAVVEAAEKEGTNENGKGKGSGNEQK